MKPAILFFACIFIAGTMASSCATACSEVREFSVEMMVPDMGWKIEIREICRVGDELWVISILEREPGMAAQMMATVSDSVRVFAPDLPTKVFVSGKTWEWENTESYVFVENLDEVKEKLKKGERIFSRNGNK